MRQPSDDFEPMVLRGAVTARGVDELRCMIANHEKNLDQLQRELRWAERLLARRRLRLVTT
jgi:hypothetical protein